MVQYKVRNWSQSSKSLENRGNISFWVTEDALVKWRATKDPSFIGAPRQYSDDAILCLMMLKMVYHLPFRQLVGFITWMFLKIGISLPIPHFTTLAERARQLGKSFGNCGNTICNFAKRLQMRE